MVIFTASTVIAITGIHHVYGPEPRPTGLAMFALALWWMAYGLWYARYWAVLGFMVVLLLQILATGAGLVLVATVPQAIATFALFTGGCVLFYFMIRAMARIQMPKPPGT